MIRNQWYAALSSKEVKKKPVGVTRFGEKLVFYRDSKGQVNCLFDQCCHRGASLSLGECQGDHLICPFHAFEYNAEGKVVTIPANGKQSPVDDRYKVHAYVCQEQAGLIWVWYGDYKTKGLPPVPFFDDLKNQFTYSEFSEVWSVHYTRAIENQLDVVHLPFVHRTTIGKGGKTLVNGPVVKWDHNLMKIYVKNEVDDGHKKPEKAKDIKAFEKLNALRYQVPNIWQNVITEDMRIFAAFVPIDETHTRIYLRFYQRFVKLPILNQLICEMGSVMNRIILHQDRRVVLTQIPPYSQLKMKEKLIPGDLPIVEFRKKREQLIQESKEDKLTEQF